MPAHHHRTIRAAALLSGALLTALLACNLSSIRQVGGQAVCLTPLDDDTLEYLTISLDNRLPDTISLEPGASGQFSVGVTECCYIYEPEEDACVEWSIEPQQGASIDPATGVLSLDTDAAPGSVYTVTADVEQGRRTLTTEVHVFTGESNPLVGRWREAGQIGCESGEERPADPAIGELIFEADGSFSVTWFPFEVYKDYWGSYTYEVDSGALELSVDRGNHIPDNVDASGSFEIDAQGRLLLKDLWLGYPPTGQTATNCGHIFTH